ncbi:hypothetical protein PIB30_016574 [Stylosanthes scabra]|uniref:Uncharacterized protein n=1 Tax=Stylosanthes scabra TaxID=79078 RepID=A0ABU6S7N7_9FABA|nr:hypothetical protein [Stylosanthes scabra]
MHGLRPVLDDGADEKRSRMEEHIDPSAVSVPWVAQSDEKMASGAGKPEAEASNACIAAAGMLAGMLETEASNACIADAVSSAGMPEAEASNACTADGGRTAGMSAAVVNNIENLEPAGKDQRADEGVALAYKPPRRHHDQLQTPEPANPSSMDCT